MKKSLLAAALCSLFSAANADNCLPMFDQTVGKLHSSKSLSLCELTAGKTVLVVNTASHCGFTPQFEGLQALHDAYADKGLVVLGFPSDDFRQEANTEEKTAEVCYVNYGVEFAMSKPISVKGEQAHPLFQTLAAATQAPNWNFNKYLVTPTGDITHFQSSMSPEALMPTIETALAAR